MNFMQACGLLVLFLAGSLVARAADDTVTMQEMVQGAQQWAQENLDTNVLNALPEMDERAVRQFFREIQQRFQGDYVVDVAALRQTAQTVLPLLESHEETRPYASWLKAQMDYLEVADEIRLTIPPPTVETNQPPAGSQSPAAKGTRALGEKSFQHSLAGCRQGICAGVEAPFRRPKGAARTGLGGGSGIVI